MRGARDKAARQDEVVSRMRARGLGDGISAPSFHLRCCRIDFFDEVEYRGHRRDVHGVA